MQVTDGCVDVAPPDPEDEAGGDEAGGDEAWGDEAEGDEAGRDEAGGDEAGGIEVSEVDREGVNAEDNGVDEVLTGAEVLEAPPAEVELGTKPLDTVQDTTGRP